MKASELTAEERWLYAPWYEKILVRAFVISLPFIGSITDFNF